jgi:hypothetical protein
MPKSKTFEEQYPIINRFVTEIGWIEIGQTDKFPSLVQAFDEGGTVYEGKFNYPSMDAAIKDLEEGIKAHMGLWGI